MDDIRFDDVSRRVASRRSVVGGLTAALAAVSIGGIFNSGGTVTPNGSPITGNSAPQCSGVSGC